MDESSILDAHLRLLFRAFHYETPCTSGISRLASCINPTKKGSAEFGARFKAWRIPSEKLTSVAKKSIPS